MEKESELARLGDAGAVGESSVVVVANAFFHGVKEANEENKADRRDSSSTFAGLTVNDDDVLFILLEPLVCFIYQVTDQIHLWSLMILPSVVRYISIKFASFIVIFITAIKNPIFIWMMLR